MEDTSSGTILTLQETRENIYSNNLDDILSTTITDHSKEPIETNTYYYEKNHLGSITKITDENGLIVEQYEYDTFGVAYASVNNVEAVTQAQGKKTLSIKNGKGSETDSGENSDEIIIDSIRYKRYNGKGKIGNTRLYTGREYDAELKLYYNRARYYSPDLGRFISRDPIDVADDLNLYGYVGNNGVMFVDLTGTKKTFLEENEGNAWYFQKEFFSGNGGEFGHSSLYFIHEGQDYLINFSSYRVDSDMLFGNDVIGSNFDKYGERNFVDEKRDTIYNDKIEENSLFIDNSKINTSSLLDFYLTDLNSNNTYNLYTDNCSDEVRKGLVAAGLLDDRNTGIEIIKIIIDDSSNIGKGYNIGKELFPNTPYSLYNEIEKAIK